MTSEHFYNETLQGEKLFECFSFTLCNSLSYILMLPNDATEKDGGNSMKEGSERGKEAREKIINRKSYDCKSQ